MVSGKLFKTVVTTILSVFLLNVFINTCPPVLALPLDNPFNLLPEEDKGRVMEILSNVSMHKGEPTRETFREFWVIWEKYKRWPEADIVDLRDYLVGPGVVYNAYVWQDKLDSLLTGNPQKSTNRAKYEKRLLALGMLTREEIQEQDDEIGRIARKEILTTEDGREYIADEAGLEMVLIGLIDSNERMGRLFSKEYIEPPQQ